MTRGPFLLASLLVLGSRAPAAETVKTVHDVRIAGNVRLDRATLLFYASLKPGSPYDEELARQDFQKLWATGLFEDLRLDTEEGAEGLVLTWQVEERPLLSKVTFTGAEGLSEEEINKNLKDRGIEFRPGTPFGRGLVERARVLMESMFKEKGYRFVKIETVIGDEGEGGRPLEFKVDEGSKVKIAKIDFEGNRAFDDGDLRGAFKKTKEQGLFCIIGKKCVFSEANFKEDLERLRDYYFDRGYVNCNVGEPDVASVGSGKARRLQIKIPVDEGSQFQVGKIDVAGNTAYGRDLLLQLNQLQPGRPFSKKRMKESQDAMSEVYGIKGYFNVLIRPGFSFPEGQNVVDVTYKVVENDIYYVHRIAFRGNTTTKDKVIRRQIRLDEGDLFNTARFKRSLFRIYQLGYFKEPQPKIEPSKEDPTRLDITIDLEEEGKNDIRVGGGVSGVEGFFGTFAFSTRNLLGTGNSLTVDIQTGKRIRNYLLSYVDPYIMDRPVSGGFDLFNRFAQYTDFERRGKGAQLQSGYQFSDFWFARLGYRWEDVRQEPRPLFDADGNEVPRPDDEIARLTDKRKVSTLSPVLTFTSVDNPTRPWRGLRMVASLDYAGGFLGGDTYLYKPRLLATGYFPLSKRTNLAVNAEWSWVEGFGGRTVPEYERFYLGGEQSIRGIPVYHVSPIAKDSLGNDILVGGNKMLQLNAEYQIKVANPLALVLFADAGRSWLGGEGFDLAALEKSFGAEVRFWTPFLQAPLRLIYSYVPDPVVINGVEDPTTNFTFSIGTTF